ncbi:ABC transporter permease [Nostoc sp. ChiSLP03a]|uniref:ABC transporter permease n=1 Tax=Nostoc sp. ChiSLP03a TaxID=3075380 RepID=UPI002AD43D57|nr:ABC transporter permease [Nostoc sp. ChiSLP03a]MDZ8216447.1 ABC transporter permease [Nostoc sp. ChiSLP03a]
MVRLKRIFAQTLKELRQLRRDRLTVALALALPILLLLLFGFAVSLEINKINLAVQDLDLTPTSREYIATFERTQKFHIVGQAPNIKVSQMLDRGEATIGLIIPPDFSRDLLRRGSIGTVQALIDGSDANTANIARSYAKAVTNAFVGNLHNQPSPVAVDVRSRFWYNPGLKNLKYIGPGAIAIALTLFPPLLAGLATAREREQGTIVQVYASSLTSIEYLLGKATAYWLVGMVEVVLVNAIAQVIFGLRFVGDPTPLLVGSTLYIACGVFWGIFIGSNVQSQSVVIEAVNISAFLLSLLMSGFIYPIANIPFALRWISNIVPSRYYILLTRDAFVRGMGWSAIWYAVVALGLLAIIFFFLAWNKLQKMQVET